MEQFNTYTVSSQYCTKCCRLCGKILFGDCKVHNYATFTDLLCSSYVSLSELMLDESWSAVDNLCLFVRVCIRIVFSLRCSRCLSALNPSFLNHIHCS